MGVMDKFLNAMRLNSDEDEYYDDDEFYDDEDDDDDEDYEPRRRNLFRSRRDEADVDDDDDEDEDEDNYVASKSSSTNVRTISQQTSSKVTPMRSVRRTTSATHSTGMQVCVIKPISVDDAREITDTLVSNRTVILNLEGLDLEIAQRIIDFSSGSCYAIGGNLQKVSNYIFVVTPSNVDISGDIQNIMSSFGDTPSLNTGF